MFERAMRRKLHICWSWTRRFARPGMIFLNPSNASTEFRSTPLIPG